MPTGTPFSVTVRWVSGSQVLRFSFMIPCYLFYLFPLFPLFPLFSLCYSNAEVSGGIASCEMGEPWRTRRLVQHGAWDRSGFVLGIFPGCHNQVPVRVHVQAPRGSKWMAKCKNVNCQIVNYSCKLQNAQFFFAGMAERFKVACGRD